VRILTGCLVALALAAPQTSTEFFARYGRPDAERFVVRPDLMLSVEYGDDNEACKMRIEPRHSLMQEFSEDLPVNMDEITGVLNEVVPPETRGKELGPGKPLGAIVGTPPTTEYENVTIIPELGLGPKPLKVSRVAVLFKRPACDRLPKYADPEWRESP
jgi:hypothetical protein